MNEVVAKVKGEKNETREKEMEKGFLGFRISGLQGQNNLKKQTNKKKNSLVTRVRIR